jgi:hypothetical protein
MTVKMSERAPLLEAKTMLVPSGDQRGWWQPVLPPQSRPTTSTSRRPDPSALMIQIDPRRTRPAACRIRLVEDLGSEVFVHLVIDHEGEERRIVAKVDPPFAGNPDQNVRLTLRGAVHLFDAAEVRRATVTL